MNNQCKCVDRLSIRDQQSNSRVSDAKKNNLSHPNRSSRHTTIYRTVVPRPRSFSGFFEIEVATFLPISKRKGDPLEARAGLGACDLGKA